MGGVRRPFSVDDVVVLVDVESEDRRALSVCSAFCRNHNDGVGCFYLRKLFDAALGIIELLNPVLGAGIASLERLLERRQPGVKLHNACVVSDHGRAGGKESGILTGAIIGDSLRSSVLPVEHNGVGRVLDNGGHIERCRWRVGRSMVRVRGKTARYGMDLSMADVARQLVCDYKIDCSVS